MTCFDLFDPLNHNPKNISHTLLETNIAMENPPFWWYLPGKMVIMEVENGSPTKMIVSFRFFGNFPLNHDYGLIYHHPGKKYIKLNRIKQHIMLTPLGMFSSREN